MTNDISLPSQTVACLAVRAAKANTSAWLAVLAVLFSGLATPVFGAPITLLASDAGGTSSFTGSTNWSNGQAPSSTLDYFVPKSATTPNTDYVIRTTNGTAAVTFAGKSLTVEGYVAFKGTNVLTINDLRLTNGLVGNYSTGGSPATGRLAGNLNVITNGVIYSGGAGLNMRIFSIITGSGALEIRQPSVVTLSATNTYTGPVTQTGSTLQEDATCTFTPSSLALVPYIATTSYPAVTNIVLAGGNLNVGSSPAGLLRVGYRSNSSTNCTALLDVSAQSVFNVNVGEFSVGINANSGGSQLSVGTANLATNNFVVATNIMLGDSIGASGGSSSMTLGAGSNYFNTPVMTVSGRKQSAQVTLPAGGVFRLDNGVLPAELNISVQNFNTSANPSGTLNLSNGTFIATLDNLVIGQKSLGNSGTATGTLLMSSNAANNVTANNILIGSLAAVDTGTPAVAGTLTFGGGNFLVNTNVTLAGFDNSLGTVTGTLNINGGTFSVGGNIADGGGTSILNVNSGIVNMQPAGAPAPGNVTVDTLTGGGVITNAAAIAVSTLVSPGTTNSAGTLTLSALDVSSGATLFFNLGSSQVIGSGSNDLLQVNGNLVLNNNPVTITALSPIMTGTYRLINYTGTLSGNTSLVLTTPATRQLFSLDLTTPGQVNLVVVGNPTNLVWAGDNVANTWDAGTTMNWNSGADVFYNGDYVTFNDSGSATPDINVSLAVQPGSMIVSNTAQAYTFDNSPISSTGTLIKRGTNKLTFANDGNNFSGLISIEAGTLSIGNGGATGSLGSGPVTNNGQLVINKTVAINWSSPISGSGSLDLAAGATIFNDSSSNSYTGTTTVENGCQFNILNNSALGATNTGTVVQSGGRVGFTALGNWVVNEPLEINGNGISTGPGALYANTANNNITLGGPITVASSAQIRIVNNNVHVTFTNTVLGNNQPLQCTANDTGSLLTFLNTFSLGTDSGAALTKDGVGTMILAGNSNLCNGVQINGGTLQINTTNTPFLGDMTVNTGTLQIGSGLADGAMPPGTLNLAGSATKLTINSSNTFMLGSVIGYGSISLLNYGTLIITNANTFMGGISTGSGTPAAGGTIILSNSLGLGDGTVAKNIRLIHAAMELTGGLDIPANISFSTSSGNVAGDLTYNVAKVIQSTGGTNIIEGTITPTSGAGNSEFSVASGWLVLNGTVSPDQTARTVILSGAGNGVLNGALQDNTTNIPALNKQGSGTWTLNNINNYSGITVVQNGTLVLGTNATIPTTPSIQIVSNATLDVSEIAGGFALGRSQTLSGIGHVLGSVSATGTVSPGPLGTLTVSANLALSGQTIMELNRTNAQNADLVSASTLGYGGTLTVTNVGDPLQLGDTFNLFDGTISGTFAATNLPALASTNLYWDVSHLNSQGIIKVAGTVATPPLITQPLVVGTNFTLQVSSQSGFNYVLQATPQLVPVFWTPLQTNAGGGPLTFTIPIASTNTQQYFRIVVQ